MNDEDTATGSENATGSGENATGSEENPKPVNIDPRWYVRWTQNQL